RHGQLRGGAFIETTARSVPRVDHRRGDLRTRSQAALQPLHAERLRVLTRRDADDTFEAALEVIGAATHASGDPREGQMPLDVGQVHAGAAHLVEPGIGRALFVRPAPATGTIARLNGVRALREEL